MRYIRFAPNPPIKGHGLKYEGKLYANPRFSIEYRLKGYEIGGGCQCGALPPDIWRFFTRLESNLWYPLFDQEPPLLPSQNAVKRWHREHKAELRKQVVQFEKEGE